MDFFGGDDTGELFDAFEEKPAAAARAISRPITTAAPAPEPEPVQAAAMEDSARPLGAGRSGAATGAAGAPGGGGESSEDDEAPGGAAKKRAVLDASTGLVAGLATASRPAAGREAEPGLELVSEMLADGLRPPVKHESLYPPDWQHGPRRVVAEPARVYPFVLDPFQSKSIDCIEQNESVLVAAHTSAGKTVVAEYAIAQSLKQTARVIYTSPIKALSNQKYRELFEQFQDVGLMTGDVTINPTASCLVMTTEILRSMLYRGSEIMREVAWVIFDEIHYMRDTERGVVWEETIILLPDTVRFVFLSATIPNASEFAAWICKIHKQPCHVVYTEFRPTPLQHYIFPSGGEGLYLVVDEKSDFREESFQKAIAVLGNGPTGKNDEATKAKRKRQGKSGTSDINKILKKIMDFHYEPVIIFSFSKRECESLALQLSKLDFNSDTERQMVELIFTNAIDSLSEDDKRLPQIDNILPLLRRGIGIHHSGLLPILKETIEILFQEGLLKALFATETFSIGLNMPAKTVVFTSVRKFDGDKMRWLRSGEYIQMSGRAGRRGLDDRGIVILMVDEQMDPAVAKEMLRGAPDELKSAFHVSYNMLLNMLRLEFAEPEFMLMQSFHQYQNEKAVPKMQGNVAQLMAARDAIVMESEEDVRAYFLLHSQLARCRDELRALINTPEHVLPSLRPGRLLRVRDGETDWGWGILVNHYKRAAASGSVSVSGGGIEYVLDVLLYCSGDATSSAGLAPCALESDAGEMRVVPVLLPLLDGLSTICVPLHKDLRSVEKRQALLVSLRAIQTEFGALVPRMDPIEHLKVKSSSITRLAQKIGSLETRMSASPVHVLPNLADVTARWREREALNEQIEAVRQAIAGSSHLFLLDEMRKMKRVLRRLGMTNAENVIEVKGRVAVEINAGDELVLAEMLFDGVFNNLSVPQTVALLSCFIFEEKSKEIPKLKETLAEPLRRMQEIARRVVRTMKECKIEIDEEKYIDALKPSLMDVVFAWANGAKFAEICKMTDIFEGSIIRAMRRLEELLRQMCNAAKAVGSTELEVKFAEGITLLKRDIVFAASLYLY